MPNLETWYPLATHAKKQGVLVHALLGFSWLLVSKDAPGITLQR